jgi:hypothetical protein
LETTIMNVQLVGPAALIAMVAIPRDGRGRDEALWRKLRAGVVMPEQVLEHERA